MALFIEDGGVQVQVAELGLIAGKQQTIYGNLERDLILRTAGNIQIQVGNKFYPLTFNNSITDTGENIVVNSDTTILAKDSDLVGFPYPGDGHFVFIQESKTFYITSNSAYVKLTNTSTGTSTPVDDIIYLSYTDAQELTGDNKLQVILNTGSVINSFSDITTYDSSNVYAGQLIYNIATNKHYVLTDTANPAVEGSWKEIYLSLSGGTLSGPLAINLNGNSSEKSLFHIQGTSLITDYKNAPLLTPALTIGDISNSLGFAVWSNGVTYLQTLNNNQGFKFLTDISGVTVNPLTIYGSMIGMFGDPDPLFNLTINGKSKLTDIAYINRGIQNQLYTAGPSGSGYALRLDPNDSKWLLEVDKLLIRSETVLKSKFETKSLNGSFWSNPSVKIRSVEILDYIDVFATAAKMGNYDGSHNLISLTGKPNAAYGLVPSDYTVQGSTRNIEKIKLAFGFGYLDYDTEVEAADNLIYNTDTSTYDTLTGMYINDGTTFTEDNSGTYMLIQTINITYIETDNLGLLSVGDLLYYATWKADGTEDLMIAAEVIAVSDTGATLYVYNSGDIALNMELIKVGSIAGVNGIAYNGIVETDYIENTSTITSFRDIFENFYTNLEGYELFPVNTYKASLAKTINKLGDLDGFTDSAYGLNGSNGIGLYSSNAYLKGNFILDDATFNSVTTSASYSPFLMLNAGKLNKIDLSTKIANWDTAYGWGNHATAGYALQVNTTPIVSSSDVTGLTSSTSIASFTSIASDKIYRVNAYVAVTSYTSGSVTLNLAYTDVNNVAQTIPFGVSSALSATNYSPLIVKIKASSSVFVTTVVTGTLVYSVGAVVEKLN